MAETGCPDCISWEKKYRDVDKELKYVKNLANKAVVEHEDLFFKYKENKKQYEELCDTLLRKDKDIEKLRNIIEPFMADFRELEIQAEVQAALKQDAENFARKAYKQCANIKRQSLSMLQKYNVPLTAIDIDIDADPDDDGDEDSATKDDVSGLQERINELEKTVQDLATELDRTKEERDDAICSSKTFEDECKSLAKKKEEATERLTAFEQMTDSFRRVSFLALEEIAELSDKYDTEKKLREEALNIAHQFQRDKKIIQHQSQAVIASAFSDQKLRNALLLVEDKTRENEMMKHDYERRIEELESSYSQSNTLEKIAHLERCIEVKEIEIDGLKKDIEEQNKRIEGLDFDKRCLQEKVDLALKQSMAPPPPPPPPPPPVKAPMPFSIFHRKKKSQPGAAAGGQKKAAVKGNENYDKALDELMKRIKERGRKQEQSASLAALMNEDKKRNSRVDEMKNVLNSLTSSSKLRPVPKQREPESESPEVLEFNRIMNMRRKKSGAGVAEGGEKKEPGTDTTTEAAKV